MIQNHKGYFFSPLEYTLGELLLNQVIVAAYKGKAGIVINKDEQTLNNSKSSPLVIAEHPMVLWKGQVPLLRNI